MTAQAYPLQWPHGRPRRPASKRKRARFTSWTSPGSSGRRDISVHEAVERLFVEVGRIGGCGLVVSSNLELRNDGLPRSGQKVPADPGVCVYFDLAGRPRAMPCDTYDTVAGNIAAVAAHIEATRAIERHGVATVAEMFEGFAALPAPGAAPAKRHWRDVMGFPHGIKVTRSEFDARFRELAKSRHPDAGGTAEAMAELNAARAEALKS